MSPTTRDPRVVRWLAHQRAAAAIAAFQELAPREPFVVVKGVALCARYGWDPSEVPISDVDVRITPRSFFRLRRRVRESRGGLLVSDSPWYGNLVLRLGHQHMVDVEATIGPPFLTRLRVEQVLARAELVSRRGAEPFLVPCTTDHALLLAVNLFKDGIASATAYARNNTVRIVEEPDFDPDAFAERARDAHMHTLARLVARELAGESAGWRAVDRALGPRTRPAYAFAHRVSHRAPMAVAARVVRRLASDSVRDRCLAPAVAAGLLWLGGRAG